MRMRGTKQSREGLRDFCSKVIELHNGGPISCVEIGSFAGEGTNILSDAFDRLICVDPYVPYERDRAGDPLTLRDAKFRFFDLLKYRMNISHLSMSSLQASNFLPANKFSVVYIDGEHSYEAVSQDIDLWSGKTHLIGGHDYNPEDKRFDGVKRAVDNFVKNKEFHTFADTSWLCQC